MWSLLFIFVALFMLSYPYWRRQRRIKGWRRALDLDKHTAMYQHLFAPVNGFALSRQARTRCDAMEYVYGEIDFISFIALLSLTKPDKNTVFYDLGSGTGKAVLACAMVFPVKKSCGIELFHELHTAALNQQQQLAHKPNYLTAAKTIHFIHDDFLHMNFSDATLVFINATGFFGQSWIALNQHLEGTTINATLITTSKKLTSSAFTVVKITRVQMSWGTVNAYIHTRLPDHPTSTL